MKTAAAPTSRHPNLMPSISPPVAASVARPGRRRRALRSDAGFTLIEVLVSALMVGLIAAATATALISTTHASADQRLRSQADALASQDQDRLRGFSDEQLGQLNGSSATRPVSLSGTAFTVKSTATFIDTTGTSSCTSLAAAYFKVVSTVSWSEGFANRTDTSISSQSLLSRPVTGDLLTDVQDQTGAWLPGVRVAASGASPQSGMSDSNGCILFAGLTPGSYTVALSDSGYVDPDGNSTPSGTANVTLTGTSKPANLPFHLGQAGSITGTFTTVGSSQGYNGEADAISWLGSGATYGMSGYRTATTAAPAATQTTLPLFPFNGASGYSSNYAVWPGRCLQQEPPAAYDRYSVTPGSTGQAQNVIEPVLYLASINYKNGATTTAVKPAHVKLTFTSTAGTACSYSWFPTLAAGAALPYAGWLANPGQPFASTATTGATASASSGSTPEAGQLTVCADYNNYKSSVTTTNTDFSANANIVPTITVTNGTNANPC